MADELPPNPEAKFTQADVDRIAGETRAQVRAQFKDYDAMKAQLAEISEKLAKSDEASAAALEAKELEGKTELEKLRIQVQKAADNAKKADGDWAKKLADKEASERAWADKYTGHVKQSAVVSALRSAGMAPKVDDDATHSFLREAQIEFGEDGASIARVTVGGKPFEKIAEAASHFLKEKPHFAAPQGGGSGGTRNPLGGNGAAGGLEQHTSVESLLGAGLSARNTQ